MKTFRNFLLLALCATLAFLFAGCQRKGCTDPNALNYEAKAKKDDGDCRFSNVAFHSNTDGLNLSGTLSHTTLTVNGATIGAVVNYQAINYKLNNGNEHSWSVSLTSTTSGVTSTHTRTGTVTADPDRSSFIVNVWQ